MTCLGRSYGAPCPNEATQGDYCADHSTPAFRLVVEGAPATKKNGGNIIMRGGKRIRSHSPAFRKFEALAVPQLRQQWARIGSVIGPLAFPVNVEAHFYLAADYQSDAHGYYQGLADLLVLAGVLADDNRKILVSWDGSRVYVDRERPRVEVKLTPTTKE